MIQQSSVAASEITGTRSRAWSFPGDQREQERQRVVGDVPGIEHAAQQHREREQEQAVVPGTRAQAEERRQACGQRQQEHERMPDRRQPARRRAVVRLDAQRPRHDVAGIAEEPPQLPGLEDRARLTGHGCRLVHRATGEDDRQHDRCRRRYGDRDGDQAIAVQDRDDRDRSQQRPRLVGDRETEQDRREQRPPAARRHHRRYAEDGPEQLLGVPDLERTQRERVRGRESEGDPAGRSGAPEVAPARPQQHAEQGAGRETRRRHRAEQGEVASTPEVWQQGERRAQHERAAIGRRQTEKRRQVAVSQGH